MINVGMNAITRDHTRKTVLCFHLIFRTLTLNRVSLLLCSALRCNWLIKKFRTTLHELKIIQRFVQRLA